MRANVLRQSTRILMLLLFSQWAPAAEINGEISVESAFFYEEGKFSEQVDQLRFSGAFEPEISHEWNRGRDRFSFIPFIRLDSMDGNRNHWDIRQLERVKSLREWEIRVGIRKVFWGVTESVHLVDIINQTDLVENFDGEDKLGQPMVNVAWVQDFGTFDFFLMTYFRERTHPGPKGRFRLAVPVSTDPVYEGLYDEWNPEAAFRYSHSFGLFDIGLSHFYGTSREPRYVLSTAPGKLELIPHYDLIHQTGLDLQLTWESWLWKLEAISRHWVPSHYFAAVGGFEYTFSNIANTGADVGLISEYLFDERDELATTVFENDLFLGLRWALNDEDDYQLLGGVILDLEKTSRFFNVEASRRIGDHLSLAIEGRSFFQIDSTDLAKAFENDSYTQLELTYAF